MVERDILFCDDKGENVGSFYVPIKRALNRVGHEVHLFDGSYVTDKNILVADIRRKMKETDCGGLIMDLKWHQDTLDPDNTLGLDIIEELVGGGILGILPTLSLDRIVIATRYPETPFIEERFLRLNCLKSNIWNKLLISENSALFAEIFE